MAQRARIGILVTVGSLVLWPLFTAQAVDISSPTRATGSITFTKEIAPLVFEHCATCHRPGEVAPFSLLNFTDVRKHSKQMVEMTGTHQMPPWKAVPGHVEFRGERRLTDAQVAMLKQWVDEGAVEGDPKFLPAAPKFPVGWEMGEPDLVVKMPVAYSVPAEGRDIYRNFVIRMEMPAGKFIRAVEYRPGNRRVVHHAGLAFDTTGKYRELDGKDGSPGFTQIGLPGNLFPGASGFWVPGKETRPLPEGVSFHWPSGADFLLQLHLHPSGKPEVEQSTIGFYFTNEPPRRSLSGLMMMAGGINIPAGEKAYKTRTEKTLDRDSELYGIFPHMHLIGKEFKVTAVLPDGTSKSLLEIDQWDFNWQSYYEYATPIVLPGGTKVIMETIHDNSAENPANPNHPPKPVTAGEQTTNEMSAMVLQFFPRGQPAARPAVAGKSPAPSDPVAAAKAYLQEANDAIKKYDKNGDGKLDADEIGQILGAANPATAEFIKRFDKDGDGKIDAAELAEAIKVLKPH